MDKALIEVTSAQAQAVSDLYRTAAQELPHQKEFNAMKAFSVLLAAAALSACAASPSREFYDFQPKIANPSAIIAADIGFNQLAQQKGQWTAFRETAGKDAVLFAPQPTLAMEWLKGQADPAASLKWRPHKAFMSCDGKTGVTTGAWERSDGVVGYFTTVWQYVEKNARGDGEKVKKPANSITQMDLNLVNTKEHEEEAT